ncbi:unnamed protein product, partial [Tetraodon nigroviridis]
QMVSQFLGPRRRGALRAAVTCGSDYPSISKRRRTTKQLSSSPSLRCLRSATVEVGIFRHTCLCPLSPPFPLCTVILTQLQTRPKSCLSQKKVTPRPTVLRCLHPSAQSPKGLGQILERSHRWAVFQSTPTAFAAVAATAVVAPLVAALLPLETKVAS